MKSIFGENSFGAAGKIALGVSFVVLLLLSVYYTAEVEDHIYLLYNCSDNNDTYQIVVMKSYQEPIKGTAPIIHYIGLFNCTCVGSISKDDAINFTIGDWIKPNE